MSYLEATRVHSDDVKVCAGIQTVRSTSLSREEAAWRGRAKGESEDR